MTLIICQLNTRRQHLKYYFIAARLLCGASILRPY